MKTDFAEDVENGIGKILIKKVDVKSVMTKSNLPVGGYSVNPYVGCTHACKYCYASFMKRFTGHKEPWGTFLDVKYWPEIKNPDKYSGERVVIGSVTDGYVPQEMEFRRTGTLLKQLADSDAKIMICTKSDLVLRDLDLISEMKDVTVSWSVNTLDEKFRSDMDDAVGIERRLDAMKKVHDAGIKTVCFISPIFPGITDVKQIAERAEDRCDFIWLENLNLRGDYKESVLKYIESEYPELKDLYRDIYVKGNKNYWHELEADMSEYAKSKGFPYMDNRLPDKRDPSGLPTVVNYLHHEEIRGSQNTGGRKIVKTVDG